MNAQRRENQSKKMKQKWLHAEDVARVLGCTKHDVMDYLMATIVELGILDKILYRDQEAIAQIQDTDAWVELQRSSRRVRVYDDAPLDTATKIRIALWFIRKIGSVDEAIAAVKAAGGAVDKLEKQ